MKYYGENRMVLPTDIRIADRDRKRRMVFYGRVSSEHEAQLSALENQLQWYDDQAKYHPNWTVVRKYIDRGITGTQAKKRPAFLKMMEDAKAGEFDLIVTREVCRFARNTVDTLVHTRELKSIGVEVFFVEDNIWTMDGDGELRLTIMATLAQEESRKTSERVRAGQKISRDNGVLYGNGNILGYDRVGGTYIINEEQAETVRLIYNLYASGLGMKKIVNELIRLKRKDGSGLVRWEMVKVSRVLHNATYKGYKCYLKSYRNNYLEQKSIRNRDESTYLYIKGDFEPIISEELWDKCKEIRESKYVKVKHGVDNAVVGYNRSKDVWVHKLKCRCGASMRKNKWRMNMNGDLVYGYKCYNQLNNGSKALRDEAGVNSDGYCDLKEFCDWKLELMARMIFQGLLGEQKEVVEESYRIYNQAYCSDIQTGQEQRDVLYGKLNKAQKKLENLTNMRMEGEISKEEYQSYKSKVNAEIEVLEKELITLNNEAADRQTGKMSYEQLRSILSQKLDFSKPKLDRELLENLIARIVPASHTQFCWYMNFLPREKDSFDEYVKVWEFEINFEQARAYKKMTGGMLRGNQWNDVTVCVYI